MRKIINSIGLGAVFGALLATNTFAQSMFAEVARVNNDVITAFEVDQRASFFRFIRRPGDANDEALKTLIEDRLKMQAVRAAGLELTPESTTAAMEEFAGRGNFTLPEFRQILGSQGIDLATLRDFVVPSVTWRELVQTRFARQARISESEIEFLKNICGKSVFVLKC